MNSLYKFLKWGHEGPSFVAATKDGPSYMKIGIIALLFFSWFNYAAAAVKMAKPPNYLSTDAGLIGYWTFDGNNILRNIADQSGAGNTGYFLPGASGNTSTTTKSGKVGQALAFDGADDYINTKSDFIGTASTTITAWIKADSLGEGSLGRIVDNGKAIFRLRPPNQISFSSDGSTFVNSAASAYATSTWTFVVVTRGSTGITNFYVGGVASGSADQSSGTPAGGSTNVIIGNNSATSATFDGFLDDVHVFNRVLSADEVFILYKASASTHLARTTQTKSSLSSGLAAWWTFDGYNTSGTSTAYDLSGNAKTATTVFFADIASSSQYATSGAYTATVPTGVGIQSATAEAWGAGGGGGGRDAGASNSTDGGGGGGGGSYSALSSTSTVNVASTTRIAVTEGQSLALYVGKAGEWGLDGNGTDGQDSMFLSSTTLLANGGKKGFATGCTGGSGCSGAGGSATSSTNAAVGYIKWSGGNGGRGADNANGAGGGGGEGACMDGAGTNGTQGADSGGAVAGFGGGNVVATAGCGPTGGNGGDGGTGAGGSATTTPGGGGGGSGESASILGGRGAHGQVKIYLYTGVGWAPGKIGQAVSLNGINQYVSAGSVSSSVNTVSFWIKVSTSTTQNILDLNGTATITMLTNAITANNFTSPTYYIDGYASTSPTISNTSWHHVTVTTGTALNASAMDIGRVSTKYCGCSIDDVRVYNRALSAAEAQSLSQASSVAANVSSTFVASGLAGGLTAFYTFDGKYMYQNVVDASGSGNNANLIPGSGGNTATTTTPGKVGQALVFDGGDDYATTTSDFIGTGADSITAWIKTTTLGESSLGRIVDNGTTVFRLTPPNTISFSSDGSTFVNSNAFSFATSTWTFVAVTRDSSGTANFYIGGVATGTANQASGTPAAGTNRVTIGNNLATSATFDGALDDIRIYGRALSATEILRLFQNTR